MQSDEDKREGPDLMVGAFIESILITDLSLAKRVKSIGAFSGFFLVFMWFCLCFLEGCGEIQGLDRFRGWN